MNVINLESLLRMIEAARAQPGYAIRAISDEKLADCLREASNDPTDHALADQFLGGDDAPFPDGALDLLKGIAR